MKWGSLIFLFIFSNRVWSQAPAHPQVCLLDIENQADCVGICSESFVFSLGFEIVEEILFVADDTFSTGDYFEYIVRTSMF